MGETPLQSVRAMAGTPDQRYLAHLYLGKVYESLGRGEDARRDFREALALRPDAQAAAVALSQALASAGDAEGARRVLADALSWAGGRLQRDPFWQYPAGNALTVDVTLDALRRETGE